MTKEEFIETFHPSELLNPGFVQYIKDIAEGDYKDLYFEGSKRKVCPTSMELVKHFFGKSVPTQKEAQSRLEEFERMEKELGGEMAVYEKYIGFDGNEKKVEKKDEPKEELKEVQKALEPVSESISVESEKRKEKPVRKPRKEKEREKDAEKENVSELRQVKFFLEGNYLYLLRSVALKGGTSVSPLVREIIIDYLESCVKKDPFLKLISKNLFLKNE